MITSIKSTHHLLFVIKRLKEDMESGEIFEKLGVIGGLFE